MPEKIRVAIAGAAGRMGRTAVRAVAGAPDMILAAALGRERGVGQDAGTVAGTAPLGVKLTAELADALDGKPDVLIDFCPGAAAAEHHRAAIPAGVSPVVAAARGSPPTPAVKGEEMIAGVRGGRADGVPVHSVRLPGLVAHQEIIFGGPGQTLTIRHDSVNEESFIPGLMLAVRKVRSLTGLVYGLEKLLDL